MMRLLRYPLLLVLVFAVLFDLFLVAQIYSHGWPPVGLGEPSDVDNVILVPTTTTASFISLTLFTLLVLLVQVVLFNVTLKAWRIPKA